MNLYKILLIVILSAGACKCDCSSIFRAVDGNDYRSILRLIQSGCDINLVENNSGRTPLMYSKNELMTAFLIEHGADVNMNDTLGDTPLYNAIILGNIHMVKLLLEKGADVNHKRYFKSSLFNGSTPLHDSSLEDEPEIVSLLIGYGGMVNGTNSRNQTPLHINMLAIKTLKTAKILIEHGANVNSIDEKGNSPLHYAVMIHRQRKKENPVDKIQFLIDNGAIINLQNNMGQTVLHIAARNKKKNVMLILLQNGADKRIQDNEGMTPLDISITRGDKEIIDLLK